MEIEKRITFRTGEFPELIEFLNTNKIKFDDSGIISLLEIYESDPHWNTIARFTEHPGISVQSRTIFTTAELRNAQWMEVRCVWHNGYPQPEDERFLSESITYDGNKLCKKCGNGLVQIDSFRIKKEPKWGQRHFMQLYWVEDEFFVDDLAKTVLQDEKITGISFREVKDKAGREIISGVNQLELHSLPECGFIPDPKQIKAINYCEKCGSIKYVTNGIGMLKFKKSIFENAPDIVKSADLFGDMICARTVFINQKAYQAIIRNRIGRGLIFAPIALT